MKAARKGSHAPRFIREMFARHDAQRARIAEAAFLAGIEEGRRLGELDGAAAFLGLADAVAAYAWAEGRESARREDVGFDLCRALAAERPPSAAAILAALWSDPGPEDE